MFDLTLEIERLKNQIRIVKGIVEKQQAQIEALRARLSPRERLRDALAECPACDHEDINIDALTEEEVTAMLASHTSDPRKKTAAPHA